MARPGTGRSFPLSARAASIPEIAAACVERDWEVLSHGVYNTRYLLGLGEEEERAVVEDCRDAIAAHWGRPPKGWMGPSLTATERTTPESSLEMSTWISGCSVPVADTSTVRLPISAGLA